MSAGELVEPMFHVAVDDDGYPYSDGKPLGESQRHIDAIVFIMQCMRELFADRRHEVSVLTDMFWYWERGNRRAVRAPDLALVFGVPHDPNRLSYKAWEHGDIVPAVIIETASQEQRHLLLGEMHDEYERLGVQEYFVFDGPAEYLPESLTGFRLRNGRYQRVRRADDGSMTSLQLGMRLRPEGDLLRLVNPRTGERFLSKSELADKYKAEAEAVSIRASAISDQLAVTTEELAAKEQELAAKEQELAAKDDAITAKEQELAAKDDMIAKLMERLRQSGAGPAGGEDAG